MSMYSTPKLTPSGDRSTNGECAFPRKIERIMCCLCKATSHELEVSQLTAYTAMLTVSGDAIATLCKNSQTGLSSSVQSDHEVA